MWGVALDLEVRLCVFGAERASMTSDGTDPSAAAGGRVELQEDVYGPFSGQVGDVACR